MNPYGVVGVLLALWPLQVLWALLMSIECAFQIVMRVLFVVPGIFIAWGISVVVEKVHPSPGYSVLQVNSPVNGDHLDDYEHKEEPQSPASPENLDEEVGQSRQSVEIPVYAALVVKQAELLLSICKAFTLLIQLPHAIYLGIRPHFDIHHSVLWHGTMGLLFFFIGCTVILPPLLYPGEYVLSFLLL